MSKAGEFTTSVDAITLQRAEEVARSVFRDWKWTEGGGHKHISTELKLGQVTIDVNREILPPLTLALMFFGGELPNQLIAKLRNRTQTRDTLFELWCLGMFGQRCKVEYEPRLPNGKVPDLCVHARRNLYVECKSHHFMDSVYWSRFQRAASLIGQQVGDSPLQKKAWGQDLRLEVYPDISPNSNDLLRLGETVQTEAIDEFVTPGRSLSGFRIRVVSRDEPTADGYLFKMGTITVGTSPTALSERNQHMLVYGWPGLRKQKQRCERQLLQDARKKLTGMPTSAVGMVCIETFSEAGFATDIHKLIDLEHFVRVPLVWLNPHRKSRLIHRDEGADLVNDLLPHPTKLE